MVEKTPYSVPASLIQEAVKSSPHFDFRISLNKPSGRFFYDSWEIKDEFKGTVWEKILNTIPGPFGEARIIQLQHGTCYMSHCDIDDRYHLNLEGQYSFLINIDSREMFSTVDDGFWYVLNAGQRHVAANFGSVKRTQLVVRHLLHDAKLKDPICISIIPTCENPRFEFDDIVSPWLHNMNKLLKLKDFTVLENSVSFKLESENVTDLDLFPKSKFKIVIEK